MPFVKKTDPQGSQPPNSARKIFIGRANELHFFVEDILKPEEPVYNIISISGQGGVGKTTLLARFIEEAYTANFKDYCMTARVDERQTTPANMMEQFADQLHMEGAFQKALKRYREVLRKQLQSERESILQRTPDFAGAAVEGVPFVGPLLGEGIKATTSHLLSKHHVSQMHKDAERLENPIRDLTRAFIEDLNLLADAKITLSSNWTKHERRIVLFFDTFEQLAAEAAPWLLDYFLTAEIHENVVLVIAGQHDIKDSLPENPKAWQEYYDNNIIYSIPLNSFTEDETRTYLTKRGITDPERIKTLWQLSQGLPLYLGMLTSNPQGLVDPTADVVANFLRWIPKQEQIKRQLALDAALFSRPFNLDDLEVFTYLPENERSSIYDWLIKQPFVLSQTARHAYHKLAQELFSRHLYQRSHKAYYATRRALVNYYYGQLETILAEEGEEAYRSDEWLELLLALVKQLFLLPDEVSHIKAIEQILNAYEYTSNEQDGEITRLLRELSHAQPDNQANMSTRQIAKQLQQFIDANIANQDQESLAAISSLLEKVLHEASSSAELLAEIYRNRGKVYRNLDKYELALEDFDKALKLNLNNARAYAGRGETYRLSNKYREAIVDFDRALTLDPNDGWSYIGRGETYYALEDYRKAIEDFNYALELDPNDDTIYTERGIAYLLLDNEEWQAIKDFDHALELDPSSTWAYFLRGFVFKELKEYNRAIMDFDHALELDPKYVSAYINRGLSYKELNNYQEYQKAIADFNHALELDPESIEIYIERGITYRLCEKYQLAVEDFNHVIDLDPNNIWAYIQRGETSRLLGEYEQTIKNFDRSLELDSSHAQRRQTHSSLENYQRAIEDFDHALKLNPNYAWAYDSRGQAHLALENYQQAIEDFDRALELDPTHDWIYVLRARAYRNNNDYQHAIQDFNQAIALDPDDAVAYAGRGETYRLREEYDQAIKDFDRAIQLDPQYIWAYGSRGQAYSSLKEYDQAIKDFDRAIELDPNLAWVYGTRGQTYRRRKEYDQAIKDFDRAIELDPKDAWAYSYRALTYLWLKDAQQAQSNYARGWELDETDINDGWMAEWAAMCQEKPDQGMPERLEAIAAIDSQRYAAYICRGVALWLHKHFLEAFVEFEQAIPIKTKEWDAYFWKGMAYASLGQDEEAVGAIEKSLELNLPPVLLTPLRWFEQDRSDFYEKYAAPLLARYNV